MSSAGATATSRCRSASAAAALPQIRAVDLQREAIPSGPLALADRCAARSRTRSRAASRRCSSSTGAAMRRSPSAAPARHRYECPNCSAWLVEHRFRRALVCHHCGHVERTPAGLRRLRQRRFARALRARASSASPRRSPSAFPDKRTHRAVERLSRRHRAAARRSSRPSRRASSTSSSARSSSPRATISRC